MNFERDILLIDTEFTGFDIDKHEIIQLAAVLLDKKTLKEKRAAKKAKTKEKKSSL